MRSQWAEMWPLAYLIGAVEHHLSLSLEPGRKTWLFVNTRSFYPSQSSSAIPFQSSANDTRRHLQHDGDPEGSNASVNIVLCCLVISGSPQTKIAIRNTSDTPAWNKTPLVLKADTARRFLSTFTYMILSAAHRDRKRERLRGLWPLDMSLGLLEKGWCCNTEIGVNK